MYEVSSGARPGRPALAAVLSAAILLGTLGLAWVQVRGTLALGPPQRIEGTNLTVRVPRGWRQHSDEPGTFTLPVHDSEDDAQRPAVGKRLRFSTGRLGAFSMADLAPSANPGPTRPATIAGIPAVQGSRITQFRFRGRGYARETLIRHACTPRGDFVRVEYDPLTEPMPGDLELLEAVCAAVRLDEPDARLDAVASLGRAGIELAGVENLRCSGADFDAVRGLYVLLERDRRPLASLGAMRTWLAPGRRPGDLLADFAAEVWDALTIDEPPSETTQAGGELHWLDAPPGADRSSYVSVAVLSFAPDRAALLLLAADALDAADARQAARGMVGRMKIGDAYPDLSAAAAAGRELAAEVRAPPALRSRFDRPRELTYRGRSWDGRGPGEIWITRQGPSGDGYEGGSIHRYANREARSHWRLAADGRAFAFQVDALRGEAGVPVSITEAWDGGDRLERTLVTRRRANERPRRTSWRIPVAEDYLCAALQDAAEVRAALAGGPSGYLLSGTSLLGPGLHSRLLQPLAASPDGRRRALLLQDYLPRGYLLEFSADGEMLTQIGMGRRFDLAAGGAAD